MSGRYEDFSHAITLPVYWGGLAGPYDLMVTQLWLRANRFWTNLLAGGQESHNEVIHRIIAEQQQEREAKG